MLLQAIPVLHFFSSQKAIFYALIDEEKPVEKVGPEKKALKEYFSLAGFLPLPALETKARFLPYRVRLHAAPTLDALTPPPNA